MKPRLRRRAQTARAQIPTFVGITPQEARLFSRRRPALLSWKMQVELPERNVTLSIYSAYPGLDAER
jgi:hypothetical protein